MVQFSVEISSDRSAQTKFDQFPDFAHDHLLAALQSLEARLEAAIKADAPVKTGAQSALIGGRVYDHGAKIAAVVGVRPTSASDARKAAALEYGSNKALTVRAHMMRLDHGWNRARNGPPVSVPDHQRTPNLPAKRFLRGPLDAIRDTAAAEIAGAVADAAREASS